MQNNEFPRKKAPPKSKTPLQAMGYQACCAAGSGVFDPRGIRQISMQTWLFSSLLAGIKERFLITILCHAPLSPQEATYGLQQDIPSPSPMYHLSRTDFADIQNKNECGGNRTMAKTIFEEMGGKYERQGDYLIPCIVLPTEEEQPIGIWGQRGRF